MAILMNRDSRYLSTTVIQDGTEQYFDTRKPIKYVKRDDDIEHTVKNGDRLDRLAYYYYGSHKYWWIIADYNELDNIFELEIDSKLVMPSLRTLHMILLE